MYGAHSSSSDAKPRHPRYFFLLSFFDAKKIAKNRNFAQPCASFSFG
jgi:hypothetical protein